MADANRPRGYWWAKRAPGWLWRRWLHQALAGKDAAERRAAQPGVIRRTPVTAAQYLRSDIDKYCELCERIEDLHTMRCAEEAARDKPVTADVAATRDEFQSRFDRQLRAAHSAPDSAIGSDSLLRIARSSTDSGSGSDAMIAGAHPDEFFHASTTTECVRPGCHAAAILDGDGEIIEWMETFGEEQHHHITRAQQLDRTETRRGKRR